jgi:hypothetical protein
MRLWTYLLDPPVLAILAFVVFYFAVPAAHSLGACLTGVISTGLVPLAGWLHLVRHPGDLRGKRKLSFVLCIAGYAAGMLVMIVFFRRYSIYLALMLSYTLTVTGLTVVNLLRYKASGHAAGATGPAAAFTIVFGWLGAISFALLALVAVSKVEVKDHTLGQLFVGAALAAASTVAAFALMGIVRF